MQQHSSRNINEMCFMMLWADVLGRCAAWDEAVAVREMPELNMLIAEHRVWWWVVIILIYASALLMFTHLQNAKCSAKSGIYKV